MTNYKIDPKDPFADLDDSDFDSAPVRQTKTQNPHVEQIGDVEIPGFVEDCPKCRGTGSYGRVTRLGHSKCTKCKGTGKLQFKTSPDARAKARKSAQQRKGRQAAQNFDAGMAALDEDVREWLQGNRETNQFAASLCAGMAKYGNLTEGQINGVRKAIARETDAAAGAGEWIEAHPAEAKWLKDEAANGNELANDLLNGQWGLMKRSFLTDNQLGLIRRKMESEGSSKASDIDLSGLPLMRGANDSYRGYFAVPDGDTRLKLRVRKPGSTSKMYGWTFVDDGAAYGSRRTYGKQAPDGLYKGDVQDQLRAILADPKEAQIAYGKLTGVCGHCGRKLEDPESVAAGIGPICAAKL